MNPDSGGELYPDIFEEISRIRREGASAALVTVVSSKGSTPRKAGARMLVYAGGRISGTVGGGVRESDIINAALEVLENGDSQLLKIDFTEGITSGSGPVCGGVMQVFIERLCTPRRAVISGAGHIGYFLYRILTLLDFRTVIIDPRPEFNNAERYPGAELHIRDFSEGIKGIEVTPNDAIVLVGPGHDVDRQMLPSVLHSSAGYVGMIGSRRKIKEVFDRLKAEGEFHEEDFKRVHSPIGLDINSESPAEIAVAIAAEIIKHFSSEK